MSERAGSTKQGNPYCMKYTDPFGNLCSRNVDRPDFISNFFNDSNSIDSHNHVRQFELGLEKKWFTKDPYFRLVTTLIGMSVSDAWKLAGWHKLIDNRKEYVNEDKKMGIKKFAGVIALQLISCAGYILMEQSNLVPMYQPNMPISTVVIRSPLSDITKLTGSVGSLRIMKDANNKEHRLAKLPPKVTVNSNQKGTLTRKCKLCNEKGIQHGVVYYCVDCGIGYNYCSIDKHNTTRDCFAEHVRRIKRDLPKRKRARNDDGLRTVVTDLITELEEN